MKAWIGRDPLSLVEWKLTTPLLHALAAHVCVLISSRSVCEDCGQPIESDIHLNVGETRQERLAAVKKEVR